MLTERTYRPSSYDEMSEQTKKRSATTEKILEEGDGLEKTTQFLGYDLLLLKDLTDTSQIKKKTIKEQDLNKEAENPEDDIIKRKENQLATTSVQKALKKMALEILDNHKWLSNVEAESLMNIFIADLAARFYTLQDLTFKNFTPTQNRNLVFRIFEKINEVKNFALDKCKKKKRRMDHKNIFDENKNFNRIRGIFRNELLKKINTREIMKEAVREIESGSAIKKSYTGTIQQVTKSEMQERKKFKETLDSVTHPTPALIPIDNSLLYYLQKDKKKKYLEMSAIYPKRDLFSASESGLDIINVPNFTQRFQQMAQKEYNDVRKKSVYKGRRASLIPQTSINNSEETELLNRKKKEEENNLILDEKIFNEKLENEIFRPEPKLEDGSFKYSNLMRNDPLLQSHTEHSLISLKRAQRRKKLDNLVTPRSRYLIPTEEVKNALVGFDYDNFEQDMEQNKLKVLEPINKRDYIETEIESNDVVRTERSKLSIRVPKSIISLQSSVNSSIAFLGNQIDGSAMDTLDVKLRHYKEIEELYEEIMKTIHENFLNAQEENDELVICPTAPNDLEIMSNAFLGYTTYADPKTGMLIPLAGDASEKPSMQSKAAGGALMPSVRLITRVKGHINIPPEDFIKNRKEAMRRITTSRYHGTLKYNLGGYMPKNVVEKNSSLANREEFHIQNYIEFLRVHKTDFVLDILVDEEAEEKQRKKDELRKLKILHEEEEKQRYETAKLEKRKKREELLMYEHGFWNPGLLEVYTEFHDRDVEFGFVKPSEAYLVKKKLELLNNDNFSQSLTNDTLDSSQRKSKSSLYASSNFSNFSLYKENESEAGSEYGSQFGHKSGLSSRAESTNFEYTDSSESEDDEDFQGGQIESAAVSEINIISRESNTNSGSNKSKEKRKRVEQRLLYPLKPAESLIDMDTCQNQLEAIWVVLKMPLDQKIEMAVKYGNPRQALKIDNAINLWKKVARNIAERELILKQAETFETKASDPKMEEAEQRKIIMANLHKIESMLTELIKKISTELKETVTYEGAPYAIKMKVDYLEMLQRLEKKRIRSLNNKTGTRNTSVASKVGPFKLMKSENEITIVKRPDGEYQDPALEEFQNKIKYQYYD
ncbi:Coiled-coil domain-containing protein 87 [Clydaea vesicula]|uniref:Coiled-coil domain-containing protein 87 n=1 Tax=Clydaea vesicula TaxID=447962 RepID=A0AAD5U3N5_9FUNG|nr:Coiled-coil domain-containing protein 87 [Clydaea vesicula]